MDTSAEYFLGDALSSVRQMTNATGAITYARSYDPYGVATQTGGASHTAYGYTGEFQSQGLVYLRARHFTPTDGRFISRDTWDGNFHKPLSLNRWTYVKGNPINQTDPSGLCDQPGWQDAQGLFTKANCDALEADLANGTTDFTEAWYAQLAARERADGLTEAAAALEYYPQGAGGERKLPSSFVKHTTEIAIPKVHDHINDLTNWYIKKNFANLAGCNTLNVGPDIYYGGRFTPDYSGIGFGRRPEQKEVAATLGTFKVYVELSGLLGKVPFLWTYKVNSQLNVHVVLLDVYNWNPGNWVEYPPTVGKSNRILDDWAANLEKNGQAKSYIHRGDYTYTDTQNNVGGPGWFFNPNIPPSNWEIVSCIGERFDKDAEGPRNKDYCGNRMP